MKLKSIELHGFKSFPDKTVLNVEHGVTIVVGPNGSGKSNVSDAVRWVLGELSSKNLRSTKMEDVIFGGAASRGPMSYCEVSLVIDNSDPNHRLLSDYDEVTVTRRYYRSGESEYLLNKKNVRLKDIYELFMNTGVGKTGYSIISQGKAAEIISQKSEERRQIFEEAAGISKYRHKKIESERKMNETNDNIVRISDILGELSSRVGPLEKEAKKAALYVELFEKKKAADISLWIYDTDKLKKDIAVCEDAYSLASQKLEIADDSMNSLETQSDKLYMTVQENNTRAESISNKLREISEKMYSSEASFKILENDIIHFQSQSEQTKSEINDKSSISQKLKSNILSLVTKRNEITKALALCENDRNVLSERIEEIQSDMDKTDVEIENADKNISAINDSITAAKIEISALEGSFSSLADRAEAIKNDISEIEGDASIVSDKIARSEKTISDYVNRQNEFKAKAEEIGQSATVYKEEEETTTSEISRLQNEIYVKSQRIESLRRMEELFEGYSRSVKSIMDAADKKIISGIHGPVSRVISVDSKHALAIETALGANVQNIIVDDEGSAKASIAYLKKENAGRATFYPITSIKPSSLPIDRKDLTKYKGFLGIASEIVSCDSKYSSIISYLLGRCVVFDNLDNASFMEKETGFKVKAVTLDGQVINAGGSYTGGSAKHDSGIFTRTYEIDKLEKEIASFKKTTEELNKKLKEIRAKLEDANAEIGINTDNVAMLETIVQAENIQLEVLKSRYDGDMAQLDSLKASLIDIENRDSDNVAKRDAAQGKIKELEKALKDALAEKDTLNEKLVSLEEMISSVQNEINSVRMTETEHRKDLQINDRDIENEKAQLNNTEHDLSELTSKLSMLEKNINESKNKIQTNKQNATNFSAEINSLEKERDELIRLSAENEKKLTSIREKLRDATHERELLFRENTRLESKRASLLADQDKRIERLWEDYELTYSDAVQLGYEKVNEDNRPEFYALVTEYKSKIKSLGHVNTNAIEEYKEVKERYEFLNTQLQDLNKSRDELDGIISKLEYEMRTRFTESINKINDSFKKVFRELFGGGTAEIVLIDPENVLESGIDINVAPPGKIIKNLMLLSGGEQAFVAIALFFAILNVNPTPFCILDEIEAALDEVNVQRFAEYIKRYSDKTQFIVITHRRGTMNAADTVYGITMQERGISKIFELDLSEAEQKIGEKL